MDGGTASVEVKVAFRRRALEQVDAAATYYERESVGLGARFEDVVFNEALVRDEGWACAASSPCRQDS